MPNFVAYLTVLLVIRGLPKAVCGSSWCIEGCFRSFAGYRDGAAAGPNGESVARGPGIDQGVDPPGDRFDQYQGPLHMGDRFDQYQGFCVGIASEISTQHIELLSIMICVSKSNFVACTYKIERHR